MLKASNLLLSILSVLVYRSSPGSTSGKIINPVKCDKLSAFK